MTRRLALAPNCHLSCHLLCGCRDDASTLRGWKTRQFRLHHAAFLRPHNPQQSTAPWYAPPPQHLLTDQPAHHPDPHQCDHPMDPHHHEHPQDPPLLFPHPALGNSTENNVESQHPELRIVAGQQKKKVNYWLSPEMDEMWSNVVSQALGLL